MLGTHGRSLFGRRAALSGLIVASLLAPVLPAARATDARPADVAGATAHGWSSVGGIALIDVPRSFALVLDLNPLRPGQQTLVRAQHDSATGQLRVTTLLGRLIGQAPDGGFSPRGILAAGWRMFVWGAGDGGGSARVWTPAFDAARSLASVDPELPCETAADASTPLAGPFEVTIPQGATPGGTVVPSPTTALVLGDPGNAASRVRVATEGGITLGRTRSGANVAQGGFALAGAVFAYGTAGGQPAMWSPKLVARSTDLERAGFVACTDVAELPALGVDPQSAPPGGPITLELPDGVVADGAISLLIGGEPAPVTRNEAGVLTAAVPMFLDPETQWPAPPTDPADLILLSDDVPVAGAPGALRVTELAPAPGSAQQAQASLSAIVDSLALLAGALTDEPGAEEQWLTALTAGIDELVNGSDLRALAGALAAADPTTRQLIDAWFASSGVLDALQRYQSEIASAAGALAAGDQAGAAAHLAQVAPATSTFTTSSPSDVELAEKMQFYETAQLFGQQVIGETNQTWSTFVGIAAGAIGLVRSIPAVAITSAILAVLDFAFNKIYLGLMPANVESFDLTLASALLDRGETTDAVLHLAAVNDPPSIGIQDFVGITLNVLGVRNGPEIQSLRDALVQTANYMLGVIQQGISTYAGDHPELNLDIEVASMPSLRWETTITDPSLVERLGQTPAVIAGLASEVNWKASDTECGEGRVFARTVANVFGDDMLDSNVATVHVRCAVVVSPGFADLPPLGTQQFTATVTGASDPSVTWTASDGVVTSGGLYTAPALAGTYTITATSAEDPQSSGTATVQVRPQVQVTPPTACLAGGAQQQFTAVVTGATDPSVTWSASGGTIGAGGLYTAPQGSGTYTVTATSVEDPTSFGSAHVQVGGCTWHVSGTSSSSWGSGVTSGSGSAHIEMNVRAVRQTVGFSIEILSGSFDWSGGGGSFCGSETVIGSYSTEFHSTAPESATLGVSSSGLLLVGTLFQGTYTEIYCGATSVTPDYLEGVPVPVVLVLDTAGNPVALDFGAATGIDLTPDDGIHETWALVGYVPIE